MDVTWRKNHLFNSRCHQRATERHRRHGRQTQMQHHYKIIKWSVLSRVAVVLLSMLSSSLVPTYDLSFDVQSSPASSSLEPPSTSSIFDSLARWDGVYFIRLAETNLRYEFEQFHAFFPLLLPF